MERFYQRLDKFAKAIDEADHVLIGAGAGLSTAAGIEYTGKRFYDNFEDFIEKYGVEDMYSATFYPYKTQEEKWAHWIRHVNLNRYSVGKTSIYQKLLKLVENKDYFVLTTNVEHQFWINDFEDKRIFATQGDYGLMQCEKACHKKLYSNEKLVSEAINKIEDCKIPSKLVPVCPVCEGNMEINVRKDTYFVEDEKWMEMNRNYNDFLKRIDGKVLLLEIGVGFNTPGIIRYPFEQMTFDNPDITLVRINRDYPDAISQNKDKTISFDEDVGEILDYCLSRI